MKKTDFLKNGPSYILPTIKYVISEPHGDLLQWHLSWALTFDFWFTRRLVCLYYSKDSFILRCARWVDDWCNRLTSNNILVNTLNIR